MLRRIAVVVVVVVGLAVVALGLSFIASEKGGEIVTLRTTDAAGAAHETRIWVVDADGRAWLRAGDPRSSWLARIREHPQVEVERGGQRAP